MKQHTKDILNQWNLLKPLRDAVKDKLYHKFSLEFNFNSNHIEGNTLTYGQTEVLLLFGKVIGEAKMKDLEEMKAHNIGLKMVLEEAMTSNPLTEHSFANCIKKCFFMPVCADTLKHPIFGCSRRALLHLSLPCNRYVTEAQHLVIGLPRHAIGR